MSLGEFKVWLEGYLESNSEPPRKQIKRIQERLEEFNSPYILRATSNNTGTVWVTTNDTSNINCDSTFTGATNTEGANGAEN